MNPLKQYKAYEEKIHNKENELVRQNKIVKESYDQLNKEKEDVNELLEHKISAMFSKLTGSFEEKKEKEEQEVFMAEQYFIQARKHQMEIVREIDELKNKQKEVIASKEEYFQLFKEKMESMMEDSKVMVYKRSIESCQQEIKDAAVRKTSIRSILKMISEMEGGLSTATAGSVIDLIGIPVVGEGLKYSQLSALSKKLEKVNRELSIINYPTIQGVGDEGYAFGAFDVLADNVVVDALALGKVISLKKKLNELEMQLNKEIQAISRSEKKLMELLKKTSAELEAYIINA